MSEPSYEELEQAVKRVSDLDFVRLIDDQRKRRRFRMPLLFAVGLATGYVWDITMDTEIWSPIVRTVIIVACLVTSFVLYRRYNRG